MQTLGRGCGLFDQGGVLLRDIIHLNNCLINLLNTRRLLAAGMGNFGDNLDHALNTFDDTVHGRTGLIHQFGAKLNFVNRSTDKGFDFLGSCGRTLCQINNSRFLFICQIFQKHMIICPAHCFAKTALY